MRRVKDFGHPEAYFLMKYQNERTGRVEWVWNSRDGMVSTLIKDPEAVSLYGHQDERIWMKHVDPYEDMFLPNFVPPVGMRVFIDSSTSAVQVVRVTEEMHQRFQMAAQTNPMRPEAFFQQLQ